MNGYGRAAQSHWAQWLPQRYATIKNPEEFFELLGTEIEREIESQMSARLRSEPETLPRDERPGWRNMARLMTEDAMLAEMAFVTPEPDPEQDDRLADPLSPISIITEVMREGYRLDEQEEIEEMAREQQAREAARN